MDRSWVSGGLGLALILAALPARADFTIPASSAVAPVPSVAGTGLNATFTAATTNIDSAQAAVDYLASNPVTATFISTQITYPNYPAEGYNNAAGVTLNMFLGKDAPSLSSASAGSSGIYNTIYEFKGYISIAQAENLTFGLVSDDGARLSIGGVQLISVDDRPFVAPGTLATADFSKAGLYSFDLVYYNNGSGGAGVELDSMLPGGSLGLVPTSVLYSSIPGAVPEPSSLILIATGTLVALGFRRRHRKAGTP
jgi:hypothetical protein